MMVKLRRKRRSFSLFLASLYFRGEESNFFYNYKENYRDAHILTLRLISVKVGLILYILENMFKIFHRNLLNPPDKDQ
jgi:hypothetical protein